MTLLSAMIANTLVLNPTGQVPGVTTTITKSYDRVSTGADTPEGSVWRVPGTALTFPDVMVVKHQIRKKSGVDIQASSVRMTVILSDAVNGKKVPVEAGFYVNVPSGTFASAPESYAKNQVAYLFGAIREAGFIEKLINAEA